MLASKLRTKTKYASFRYIYDLYAVKYAQKIRKPNLLNDYKNILFNK